MKMFNCRVDDIDANGVTSCDDYSLTEIEHMLSELRSIFPDKLVYDGEQNVIKKVTT